MVDTWVNDESEENENYGNLNSIDKGSSGNTHDKNNCIKYSKYYFVVTCKCYLKKVHYPMHAK